MESSSAQGAAEAAARAERLAQLSLVESRLANERKSTFLAYVLWILFGTLGVHCFYLRNWIGGLIRLIGIWCGTPSLIALFTDSPAIPAMIMAAICAVAWLLLFFDLFRIPGMVQACTNKRRKALTKKLV